VPGDRAARPSLPGRTASLDVARLRRSRARHGSHSCGFAGRAWHRPAAPVSRRGQWRVAPGSRSAFPCLPQSRSGRAPYSKAGPPLCPAPSHLERRGLSGGTYSFLGRYQCDGCGIGSAGHDAALLVLDFAPPASHASGAGARPVHPILGRSCFAATIDAAWQRHIVPRINPELFHGRRD
jgi:hypothetical protein